ncbi:MAG: hypothetical protein ABMA01_14145, partial [Chthoniobacteraceae bacterium]
MQKISSPAMVQSPSPLDPCDTFQRRHLGSNESEIRQMLGALGLADITALIGKTVPSSIRNKAPITLPDPLGESQAIEELRALASKNR